MKIIIIGLGNFGKPLAIYLMNNGHEVFGVDNQIEKVNLLNGQISHVICMDATNEIAYNVLPIQQADLAIVAIGENEGASIVATAILKKYNNLKIISRSLSEIHDTILDAMDVHDVLHPEQDAALKLTKRISFNYDLDYFKIDNKYSIAEVKCPHKFIGKKMQDLDINNQFKIKIITIMRNILINGKKYIKKSSGIIHKLTYFNKGDILVIFGSNHDIIKFIHKT